MTFDPIDQVIRTPTTTIVLIVTIQYSMELNEETGIIELVKSAKVERIVKDQFGEKMEPQRTQLSRVITLAQLAQLQTFMDNLWTQAQV